MWRCLCVFLCTSGFSALLPFCVRSAQNCAHYANCGAVRNYNPSICRPVPSDKGVTLADTLKWGSAKGSSAKRHPRKGQERNSAPCSADRNQIPCICPERQHEKYKLRDFFSEACTHAENLCAALYGVFLCRSVAFPVEQDGQLTRAYSVRKC